MIILPYSSCEPHPKKEKCISETIAQNSPAGNSVWTRQREKSRGKKKKTPIGSLYRATTKSITERDKRIMVRRGINLPPCVTLLQNPRFEIRSSGRDGRGRKTLRPVLTIIVVISNKKRNVAGTNLAKLVRAIILPNPRHHKRERERKQEPRIHDAPVLEGIPTFSPTLLLPAFPIPNTLPALTFCLCPKKKRSMADKVIIKKWLGGKTVKLPLPLACDEKRDERASDLYLLKTPTAPKHQPGPTSDPYHTLQHRQAATPKLT